MLCKATCLLVRGIIKRVGVPSPFLQVTFAPNFFLHPQSGLYWKKSTSFLATTCMLEINELYKTWDLQACLQVQKREATILGEKWPFVLMICHPWLLNLIIRHPLWSHAVENVWNLSSYFFFLVSTDKSFFYGCRILVWLCKIIYEAYIDNAILRKYVTVEMIGCVHEENFCMQKN